MVGGGGNLEEFRVVALKDRARRRQRRFGVEPRVCVEPSSYQNAGEYSRDCTLGKRNNLIHYSSSC